MTSTRFSPLRLEAPSLVADVALGEHLAALARASAPSTTSRVRRAGWRVPLVAVATLATTSSIAYAADGPTSDDVVVVAPTTQPVPPPIAPNPFVFGSTTPTQPPGWSTLWQPPVREKAPKAHHGAKHGDDKKHGKAKGHGRHDNAQSDRRRPSTKHQDQHKDKASGTQQQESSITDGQSLVALPVLAETLSGVPAPDTIVSSRHTPRSSEHASRATKAKHGHSSA